MRFFKKLLAFLMILVIVGGLGYVGYLYWQKGGFGTTQTQPQTDWASVGGHSGHSVASDQTDYTSQSMDSSVESSSNTERTEYQNIGDPIALAQMDTLMKNEKKLNQAMELIEEALRLMTVDPFATNSKPDMGSAQNTPSVQNQATVNNVPNQPGQGNNTTINIYSSGSSPVMPMAPQGSNPQMTNMGVGYDPNKMEQVHASLYQVNVGMAMLRQLKTAVDTQTKTAGLGVQDKVQYFTSQYNYTLQNKSKLDQALSYLQSMVNLSSLNPYISGTGLVYDKDRMTQVHQSISKLAEGITALHELQDELASQLIYDSSQVQYYYNNIAQQQVNHSNMPTQTDSTGLFGGLFDNINMVTLLNIIQIFFIIALIVGVFGVAFSLIGASSRGKAQG